MAQEQNEFSRDRRCFKQIIKKVPKGNQEAENTGTENFTKRLTDMSPSSTPCTEVTMALSAETGETIRNPQEAAENHKRSPEP